uniref:Uncharacterized protein n=2 Tax=Anguilla anguilla TaxID=7936 RepID=A0A0E9SBS1_ANGAN
MLALFGSEASGHKCMRIANRNLLIKTIVLESKHSTHYTKWRSSYVKYLSCFIYRTY